MFMCYIEGIMISLLPFREEVFIMAHWAYDFLGTDKRTIRQWGAIESLFPRKAWTR